MISVTINDVTLEVQENTTILQAAKKAGFSIPTLCYHEDLKPTSACGICVVEVEGSPTPKRSCSTPVWEGMKVKTNTKHLRELRKSLLELILADHDVSCPTCVANGKCELQSLAYTMNIDTTKITPLLQRREVDYSSYSIVRDPNKCINCGRCIQVCSELQTVNALTFSGRGFDSVVDTAFNLGMSNSVCVNCGQCTVYCPTGALREKDDTDFVWEALMDEKKHVIVQEAPSIRASLGEEFGMEFAEINIGKMYAALKRLGFNAIFDTNFSADLTIIEEGTEVINRILNNGKLPCITSCSPGWIKFMETFFPDLACNVSTAKSPQQMMGALAKTYYAQKQGIDPANIVSVSIMPCTAKKFESKRSEHSDSGYNDVDYVLTTREFIRMLKEAGINLKDLPEEEPFYAMSEHTGAGTIFGATGGVMEAALRSVYFLTSGKNLEDVEIKAVRGLKGIKEAEVDIPLKKEVADKVGADTFKAKVAVAHGLGNARKLMEKIQEQIKETGKSEYTFVEIMACPGGCVGGGGQPFGNSMAMRARRGESLYNDDRKLKHRQSHENDSVWQLYKDFIGEPGSEKAHKLLHTHYYERDQFKGQVVEEIKCKHS
ncbi:MAG: NADH-dependent [FeFe] hydrogenase, group A6 [Candidatus Cloacimonetes bacterium]|nr:NADH-dependent [FeFe] hydrogenase, group A6 [Candidatus Cloacimonadota bacterium]